MRTLFFFLLLVFSSCGSSDSSLKKVRIALSSDPTSLDPRKARDLEGFTILHMLFEGLIRFSKEDVLEPALAEAIEISEDRLTYTFTLRDSVWSNGDPVTAEDFEQSWKRILDPSFPTDIASYLYPIKNGKKAKEGTVPLSEVGIFSIDKKTLVVKLENPTPYFLTLLTMPPFFPTSQKVDKQNSSWALQVSSHVSNGPFSLKEWDHSDQLLFVKNPTYWEANSVHQQAIQLLVLLPDTALKLFEEGKVDWIGSPLSTIPFDAIQNLKEQHLLTTAPFAGTYFYRVNTSDPFLSDPKIRRALGFSLDRESIVEHILQGGYKSAYALVPPEMNLFSEKFTQEEECKECKEPLILSYLNTDRNAALAQVAQKTWKEKLNLDIVLEAIEPKVFYKRISEKKYQIAAGSWIADFKDPINFLEVFQYKKDSPNNTDWENREYIDLLTRSQLCSKEDERRDLLRQAEAILLGEMPIIPVFHFALNFVKRDGLEGVYLSSIGQLDLRWSYWTP